MHIVGPFTQEIEHLRKSESHQKIVGAVRIADAEKCCRPSVTHTVKFQFVVAHNFPELGMAKGARRAPQEIKMLLAVLPLLNLYFLYCFTAKQSGLRFSSPANI